MRFLVPFSALCLAVTACTSTASGTEQSDETTDEGVTVAAEPVPFEASIALEPAHELVGRLFIEGAEPFVPTISVVGAERSFSVDVGEPSLQHEVPIAGLRAESGYTVEISAGGESTQLAFQTGSIPEDFPQFDVPVSSPIADDSGFTLFNLLDVTGQLGGEIAESDEVPEFGYLVIVDAEGEVVWYHRTAHPIGDVRQLDDGTILHEYNDTAAMRINLFGETLDEWAGRIITGPLKFDAYGRQVTTDEATLVDVDSMHHEFSQLPDGNYLTLSTELITYAGFDSAGLCGETEPTNGTYELIADIIVVFTPEGEIVESYPLARYLDPVNDARDQNVCGLPFDAVFPNWLYRAQGFAGALDWTHANSVVLDPSGDALTVSVRNIDAVLQIERGSGDLLWRFGINGDFEMSDPSDFPYHQHALEWQADGTLVVYDNGNGRPSPVTGSGAAIEGPYSRTVGYRLDPENGTAELVWQYISSIDEVPVFAAFVGDADRTDAGSFLITDGGLDDDRPDGVTARIIEVMLAADSSGEAETLFDLRVAAPSRNIVIYRAERITTFYP